MKATTAVTGVVPDRVRHRPPDRQLQVLPVRRPRCDQQLCPVPQGPGPAAVGRPRRAAAIFVLHVYLALTLALRAGPPGRSPTTTRRRSRRARRRVTMPWTGLAILVFVSVPPGPLHVRHGRHDRAPTANGSGVQAPYLSLVDAQGAARRLLDGRRRVPQPVHLGPVHRAHGDPVRASVARDRQRLPDTRAEHPADAAVRPVPVPRAGPGSWPAGTSPLCRVWAGAVPPVQ